MCSQLILQVIGTHEKWKLCSILPISTAVLEVSPNDPYSHLHDLDNFPLNTSKRKESLNLNEPSQAHLGLISGLALIS